MTSAEQRLLARIFSLPKEEQDKSFRKSEENLLKDGYVSLSADEAREMFLREVKRVVGPDPKKQEALLRKLEGIFRIDLERDP